MNQLISLLSQYHLYIMIAALLGCIFIPKEYRQKMVVLFLMVLLAFSIGYELAMDEPVTELPDRVMQTLNQTGPGESENLHYHKTPETRSEDRGNTKGDFQTMD